MNERCAYFAYGSNMFTPRLQKRTPSAVALGIGYVDGYRLAFDKVSTDGSGKCNIVYTGSPRDRVYGVLFDIAVADVTALDNAEGLGKGYRKSVLTVVAEAGIRQAYTYIADKTAPSLKPYDWYKEFVVRGAEKHGLPDAYRAEIKAVISMPDSREKRSARNWAFLENRLIGSDL